tara:strand:- start:294 stop:620 length:327 start_codon:yes stop_codon:yes gene_type:complete
MAKINHLYSEKGLGLDVVNVSEEQSDRATDIVIDILSDVGLTVARDYQLVGVPLALVEKASFPFPRLRVAEENSFGLDSGFYFGQSGIEEFVQSNKDKILGAVDGSKI